MILVQKRGKKNWMANDSFAIFQLKYGFSMTKKRKEEVEKRECCTVCISYAFYSMFYFMNFRSFDDWWVFHVFSGRSTSKTEKEKRCSNHYLEFQMILQWWDWDWNCDSEFWRRKNYLEKSDANFCEKSSISNEIKYIYNNVVYMLMLLMKI